MAYSFDAFLAADPSNPANVAANAAITIFDPADPTHAPVTITDLTGLPIANPITVNKNGFGPAFMHETLDRVGWAGGGFEGLFTSYEGLKNEAVAARTAAESAVNDAGTSATAATEAAAAAEAAAALVGAPADDVMAATVNTPNSATRAAMDTYIAPRVTEATIDALAADSTIRDAAAASAETAAQGLGYVTSVTGKNLYNSATDTIGGYFRQTDGAWVVLAGYRGSDFIKVAAGQTYTISAARFINTYNTSKVFVSGLTQTQGVYTWTPSADGYVRFSYAYSGSGITLSPVVQMEKGAAVTSPEPFRRILNGYELGGTPSTLAVSKTGNALTIGTALGTAQLTITANLAGGGNEVFNFTQTNLGPSAVHINSDDIAPIRNQHGTIGANHGFALMGAWNAADHDKTTADLGSVWTDGTRQYVLLSINSSGQAIFGGSYTIDGSGVVQHATVAPTANLTHVSGATHLTALDYTKKVAVAVVQLYPAIGKKRQTVLLDGVTLTDGDYRGRELEIRESYEVLDYASIYDTAKANIGVPYSTLNVAGAVRVESVYKFREGCVASVDVALTEIKPTSLGQCGAIQAVALNTPATRYVPGVKTIGGFNWSTGVDLAAYSVSQLVSTSDLQTAGVPPIMSLDVRSDIAFAMGYKPWAGGATSNAARIAEAPTNLWDLRNTDKSYPTVILTQPAGWGRYEAHAFRAYLTPAQAAKITASGADALGAYAALESGTALP